MKIMIVEDELNIREGLKSIVNWKQIGFESPLLFSDAVEALHYLETESVDVVITDLYMPVLNGIEFIRMLREQNQICEVVILTGHERFDLAQEAITLGVKRYLLKPVSENQLHAVLQEVREEIQDKMKMKDWIAIANQKISEYLPVIQNQFWNDLLFGNLGDLNEIERRAQYAEIHLPDMELSCLAIRKQEEGTEIGLTQELAFRQLVEEVLKEKYIYSLVYNSVEVVICQGRISRFHIEILEEAIRQNFHSDVFIGVSTIQKGMLSIKRLTKEAIDAVQSIHKDSAVFYIYYKDIENKRKNKVEYPYEEEKRILDYIRLLKELDDHVMSGFLYKSLPPQYSVEESKILLLQLLSALGRIANEFAIDIVDEFKEAESCIYKFQKIESAFLSVIRKLWEEKAKVSKNYTSIIVETAIVYMKEHFDEQQISVGRIAKASGVTPNYLSRVFKSKTGMTCIDFLTMLRMETAKELLCNSEKKSYEIAEEVGYNNPNYFGALFKKYTGSTPKEYREG